MQNKWETARNFWEGEVREEGRKAVRTTEGLIVDVISKTHDHAIEGQGELQQARAAVGQAQLALDELSGTGGNQRGPS
jgi:hypothetical protein